MSCQGHRDVESNLNDLTDEQLSFIYHVLVGIVMCGNYVYESTNTWLGVAMYCFIVFIFCMYAHVTLIICSENLVLKTSKIVRLLYDERKHILYKT